LDFCLLASELDAEHDFGGGAVNIDPNWLSALAAMVAAIFSIWAHRSAENARQRADSLNVKFAEAQTRLAHQSWTDDYFREITAWASGVCIAISEAIHIVDTVDEVAKQRVLIALSASIDMGRWYFPNRKEDQQGSDKEPAYRGERQPCLDWIVMAYEVLEGRRSTEDRKDALWRCQRNFVSCIQEIVDPRSREAAIVRVLSDFGVVSSLPKVESPE
jgi:hypothetical protein